MNAVLAIDFGSTYTKITAINANKPEIIGTAKAFTTIQTDIRDGLSHATEALLKKTGPLNVVKRIAASSAAGGLKMVAVGLVPSLTAKAAYMAACSAGAKVVKTFSYEMNHAEFDEISKICPDLVLLSGGTDGGNKDVIIHNAKMLAKINCDFSVIIAGNKSASDEVREILKASGKNSIICHNVMPEFGRLNIMPAKEVIRDLFLSKIIKAKGLSDAAKLMDAEIIPTPLAVFEATQLYAEHAGDVMVIDVGGATTDVCTVCEGKPTKPDVVLKGLPEPVAKRSVEGELGMRYSLRSLVDSLDSVPKTFDDDILNELLNKIDNDPSVLMMPGTTDHGYEEMLCALGVKSAVQRHAGKLERVFTALGEGFYQVGKDLSGIKHIIGVGGPIVYAENPGFILEHALVKHDLPEFLKPVNPQFLIDQSYVFSAMGLYAYINRADALQILINEVKNI